MRETRNPILAEVGELAEAAIEGRLTEAQRDRLESLVLGDAEARRFYVERLHLHGCLRWSAGGAAGALPGLPRLPSPLPAGGATEGPVGPAPEGPRLVTRIRRWAIPLAAAAVLAVMVRAAFPPAATPDPVPAASAPVATLTTAKACKWDGATLPTEVGSRLPAGRLRLAEGLIGLVFDSGAEVAVEAPAELELVSARKCILRSGRLVAKVPPPAIGFTVDTPTAELVDQGTEFAVSVSPAAGGTPPTADVQVFEGLVDATHRGSGKKERLTVGRGLRLGPDSVAEFDPRGEPPADPPAASDTPGARVVRISTATGRGKDAYVQQSPTPKDLPQLGGPVLLVKNTIRKADAYNRKAYLGMDLSPLAGSAVREARLSLVFVPTGMGYAAEVPDSTFAVYGVADPSADGWDEGTLRWNTAPGNAPGGADVDRGRVVRLGEFRILQGERTGVREVSGEALVGFLNGRLSAGGTTATFIVVRETAGSGRADLVHGFASRRDGRHAPPTLTVTVAGQ